MSEPITWRSISAPNFNSTAALLHAGGDTMNQGITGLSTLAKGIVDDQKTNELNNALATLSGTKDEQALGSAYESQLANLRNKGVDLTKFIESYNNKHTALQGDAKFLTDQETAKLGQATSRLQQEGLGITNKTNQGALDYQATAQADEHTKALKNLEVMAANIRQSDASAASSASSVGMNNLRMRQIQEEMSLSGAERKAANIYSEKAFDPTYQMQDKEGNVVANESKIFKDMIDSGFSASAALKGKATYALASDKAAKQDLAATAAKYKQEDDKRIAEQKDRVELETLKANLKPLSDAAFIPAVDMAVDSGTGMWRADDPEGIKLKVKALAAAIGNKEALKVLNQSVQSDGYISPSIFNKKLAESVK